MKDLAPVETLETLSPEFNAGRLGEIALRKLPDLEEVDLGIDISDLFQA